MKGKVAVMSEPGKLSFAEYGLPEPGPGAVLVKVVRTNVCGSELHIWQGHHPTKKSGVMGHEMVGEIAALGEGVTTDYAGNPVQIGDRVAAAYFITCRKCAPCQQGQMHLCENAYKHWVKDPEEAPHFHGTFGTHYYLPPDQYFYKVPDNVPDAAAASANCALSQVYFGIDKTGVRCGDTVVIQGAGGLGLNASAVAKEYGATVICIDGVTSRLEKSRQFGADHLIHMSEYDTVEKRVKAVQELTGGKGADVCMELTGVPAALNEGVNLLRYGGKYISIGNISPGQMTSFDPGLMTRKALTIYSYMRYEPWYLNRALHFISKNIEKYPFDELLDAEFDLEDVNIALDKSAAREITRATIVANR
ncbi:zinc-binding dehydrogenase [Brevibacillus choshinensis]|uniref:Zinc-binding dehydrogenase n=1 Tax=Brevibacillus choshinensis TaxID=54911 RepID=A0ABX7FS14_BRECH|nr:zinc-binding dehydrogenase [Brevibacillus choshinensis]QRG69031.1 zinc-binding dehydrogenase [Brevibacillus choshinensis]